MKKFRPAVAAPVLKPTSVCSPDGDCSQLYQLLLVHKPRMKDAWQLPQGGIEEGESMEQAAVRELEEETGLKVGKATLLSKASYSYDFPPDFLVRFKPKNAGQTLCFAVFIVESDPTVKADGKEIDSFVWILPEQLPRYIVRKEYLKVIEEVIAESKSVLPKNLR